MKKNRSTLKDYFKKGAIPTADNFGDLIDSMLNQEEDGISKIPNDPLKITAIGVDEALVNFYRIEKSAEQLSWQIKQKSDGKAGLSISDTAANRLFIENGTGNIGVGTPTPGAKLDVLGAVTIQDGGGYAAKNGFMSSGSLTIGSINKDFGGGTGGWNPNTAGLLLEARNNTEIAVHDSGTRVSSLMYYEGDTVNRLTIGRDMGGGWGAINSLVLNGNVGIGTGSTAPNYKLEVVGDVSVGQKTATPATGYGAKLYFNGVAENSDPLWMARYNQGENASYLRVNLSDDNAGDIFQVGYTYHADSKWYTAFSVETNGTTKIAGSLTVTGGTIQLDGAQKIIFSDAGVTNSLKLQLWSGYGLGINDGTLFYAAANQHSWRDNNGVNERMLLTTGADGGLTVKGTGVSSFAGSVSIGSLQLKGFTAADADEWPNILWYRDTAANWDEGLIKSSSGRGKFGKAGFGIHMHQSRQFGLFSTGWDSLLAVEGGTGNTFVKGDLTANSIRSRPFVQSFKVDGDASTYYPVVFVDDCWADGTLELEINRPSTHTDSQWRGSLMSTIRSHSSAWGHGSSFCRAEIYADKKQFIGGYQNSTQQPKLIVWLLGGGTTYYWRSNHRASLEDASATAKAFGGDVLPVKTKVDNYVTYGGETQVYFSAYVDSNARPGTIATLPMQVVSQNVGGGYDITTSTFTAPVKGIYLFTMTAYKAEDSGALHWYLLVNGSSANAGGTNANESTERTIMTMNAVSITTSRTMIIVLNAGDKVTIKQEGSGRVDNFRSGLEGVLISASF